MLWKPPSNMKMSDTASQTVPTAVTGTAILGVTEVYYSLGVERESVDKKTYIYRINQVMDYVRSHLDEELSLQTLASLASFSPFHFHRIFKAMTGETVNDFVRRLRLEKAANQLRYQLSRSVTEIALACGFASSSTFARAFTQHFGITPSECRKTGWHAPQNSKIGKHDGKNGKEVAFPDCYDGLTSVATEDMRGRHQTMNVEVKQLPAYHIAYVRVFEGYNKGVYSQDISGAFDRVAAWLGARDLLHRDTLCLGVTFDNLDLTATDRCRYDAGFTIPATVTSGSGEVGIQDVPGGRYAVCRVAVENPNGNHAMAEAVARLGEAVDYLYGTWLPDSGYELEDRPCLELYHTPPDAPTVVIEFCLPVTVV